jgi:histone H3/H4
MATEDSTQNEPFQIVLTLDTNVGYDREDEPVSLGDMVVAKLVRNLTEKFEAQARQQLHAALAGAIEAKATELVETAVQAPIRKTNTWGEPVGEPTTLRDMIDAKVKEFLNARIDSGYSRTSPQSFIQNLVGKQVAAEMEKEFKDSIQKGKEQLLSAVKDRAAEVISESLRRVVIL